MCSQIPTGGPCPALSAGFACCLGPGKGHPVLRLQALLLNRRKVRVKVTHSLPFSLSSFNFTVKQDEVYYLLF